MNYCGRSRKNLKLRAQSEKLLNSAALSATRTADLRFTPFAAGLRIDNLGNFGLDVLLGQ
jgi:hypothetical protein